MSDRVVLTLFALFALAMIGFAAVWPQGLGARSPGPFGHVPVEQTPAMRAAMARQAAKQVSEAKAAAAAAAAAKEAAAQIDSSQPTGDASAKTAGLRPSL